MFPMSGEEESEFSVILKEVQSQIDEFPDDVDSMEIDLIGQKKGPGSPPVIIDTQEEDALITSYQTRIRQLQEDVNYLKAKTLQFACFEQKKALIELELSKHYNCSSAADINLETMKKQLEWTEDWTGVQINNTNFRRMSEKDKSGLTLIQLEGSFRNVQFSIELTIEENPSNRGVLPFIAKVNVQIIQAGSYELTEVVKRFKHMKSVNEFIKNLTECIRMEEDIYE